MKACFPKTYADIISNDLYNSLEFIIIINDNKTLVFEVFYLFLR